MTLESTFGFASTQTQWLQYGWPAERCLGKVRHVAASDSWIQDKIAAKELELAKTNGSENLADMLTTHANATLLTVQDGALDLKQEDGKAESAEAKRAEFAQSVLCSVRCLRSHRPRARRGMLNRYRRSCTLGGKQRGIIRNLVVMPTHLSEEFTHVFVSIEFTMHDFINYGASPPSLTSGLGSCCARPWRASTSSMPSSPGRYSFTDSIRSRQARSRARWKLARHHRSWKSV